MSARNQVAKCGSQHSWEARGGEEEDGWIMIKKREGKCNEIRGGGRRD